MIIPAVPNAPIADKDGNVNNEWRLYFESITKQLQFGFPANVLTATYQEQTTAEIASLPSGERNGKFIFDTDTVTFKAGFNDMFKTLTTT